MNLWLVQMELKLNDKESNLRNMTTFIDQAIEGKADIVAFPELALTGYMCRQRFAELAEPAVGPSTAVIVDKLRGTGLYAIFGMPEAKDGFLYNSAVLVGPEGIVGVWRKKFLPTARTPSAVFEEHMYFRPGSKYQVFDTIHGRLGIFICMDAFYPEVSRALAFRGATLLVCISAAPVGVAGFFHPQGAARARENTAYFAYVNEVGQQEEYYFEGGSFVANNLGQEIKSASMGQEAREGILQCEIDMEAIAKARLSATFLRNIGPEHYRKVADFMEEGLV